MMALSNLGLFSIFLVSNTILLVSGAGGGSDGNNLASSTDNEIADEENAKILHTTFPLILHCEIPKEKDVKLNGQWYKDNELIVSDDHYEIFENSTLLVKKSIMEDVGLYKCEADSQVYEIRVIYLTYKKLPKSMTVLQGDKLSIMCDVDGKPTPTVSWLKDDEPVETSVNMTHFFLSMNDFNVTNAVFNIEKTVFDDRAQYKCFIQSSSISYNTTTLVRVKDMYAALWPFLGICAEVFILCLIILIYEKKRAKADFEESDTDQPAPDITSKADHNKESLRQRK